MLPSHTYDRWLISWLYKLLWQHSNKATNDPVFLIVKSFVLTPIYERPISMWKACLLSLVIREMQVKYHKNPTSLDKWKWLTFFCPIPFSLYWFHLHLCYTFHCFIYLLCSSLSFTPCLPPSVFQYFLLPSLLVHQSWILLFPIY